MVRVWVDDVREPPGRVGGEDDYQWARTYDEAIFLLAHQKVDVISIDHDLGGTKTGYDVVCWIEEQVHYGRMLLPQIFCHSQNPVGRQKILAAVERMIEDERSIHS